MGQRHQVSVRSNACQNDGLRLQCGLQKKTARVVTITFSLQNLLLLSLALLAREPAGATEASPPRARASHPVIDQADTRVAFEIGDSTVHARSFLNRQARPVMVNVHDDENTSVKAARTLIEKTGGHLIELVHTGKRNVTFDLSGNRFAFDPNRIFTAAGLRRSIRGPEERSEEAKAEVGNFARQFIEFFRLDQEPAIVALHNNTDGALSVKTYAPGGRLAPDAADTYANPKMDPDDFLFVTDHRFFDYLKGKRFNVVLQDNQGVADDGSLSVYFARKGIPYVNVEAQNGHRRQQLKMMKAVRTMLDELRLGD